MNELSCTKLNFFYWKKYVNFIISYFERFWVWRDLKFLQFSCLLISSFGRFSGHQEGEDSFRVELLPSQGLHLELRRHPANLGEPGTHRSGHQLQRRRRSDRRRRNRSVFSVFNFLYFFDNIFSSLENKYLFWLQN